MKLILSEQARNSMAEVIANLIDAGGKAGRIELTTFDGTLLSVLKFQYPSAGGAVGGQLQFKQLSEDTARASGIAQLAQVRDSDGVLILECDVTDAKGDGVIKLNSNQIAAGGPVRLSSFLVNAPK